MPPRVQDPELFGVTDSSVTLSFGVVDGTQGIDAPAQVLLDGEVRAVSEEGAGTRLVRIEGLRPRTRYQLDIVLDGAPAVERSKLFPDSFETLPASHGRCVATLATLNDLHFGEPHFGGTPSEDGGYTAESEEYPAVHASDTEVPYWQFMNEDAVADINRTDVDMTVIKGDIADAGRKDQFESAARTFAELKAPHHAFLGNHDHYALLEGERVDGYALLGQDPAPRHVDLAGWRLVLLDSVEPGEHHGVFPEERRRWLESTLAETRELGMPTLLLIHHQPVPPQHRNAFPNRIGMLSEHSMSFLRLIGEHPQVKGTLIGHTHRNRVRHYAESGPVPFIEVNCTKDYPGGWAHYRLYDDGSFSQEVRRTSSPRALAHSTRCRHLFGGGYRDFSLGPLSSRSFLVQEEP